MPPVQSVSLRDVVLLENWLNAPIGTLLQGEDSLGLKIVGMRCEMRTDVVPRPFLLVIDGGTRGRLLEEGQLPSPMLDVSLLLELGIADPFPRRLGPVDVGLEGIVCESVAGSGHLFVRGVAADNLRGTVWLTDPDGTTPIGTVENVLPPESFVVGNTAAVLRVTQ